MFSTDMLEVFDEGRHQRWAAFAIRQRDSALTAVISQLNAVQRTRPHCGGRQQCDPESGLNQHRLRTFE